MQRADAAVGRNADYLVSLLFRSKNLPQRVLPWPEPPRGQSLYTVNTFFVTALQTVVIKRYSSSEPNDPNPTRPTQSLNGAFQKG